MKLISTASQRVSISGSLRTYARKNQIFTQVGGNTFGLVEWGRTNNSVREAPPPGFGLDSEDEAA